MLNTPPSRTLTVESHAMKFSEPFRISGYAFEGMPSVLATIRDGPAAGRGEAAGVYYLGDDLTHMLAVIGEAREAIAKGAGRSDLQKLMPPGGARNALDCALWELESRMTGKPVWALAAVGRPRALVTTFTLPADDPVVLERKIGEIRDARAIKLKLDGDYDADRARLQLVRKMRPDAWLAVDANQGYSAHDFDRLEQALVAADVALLEQPIARGAEHQLEGWRPPFPVAADESILDLAELDAHGERFDVINIKLDKCGGLTEALTMARRITAMGRTSMVGNMGGSGLAMAPAFIVAQYCEVVDLDGPWGLEDQRDAALIYSDGKIDIPAGYWGV